MKQLACSTTLSLSHWEFFDTNIAKINTILAKNSFPPGIIRKLINQVLHDKRNHGQHQHNTNSSYPLGNHTMSQTEVEPAPEDNDNRAITNQVDQSPNVTQLQPQPIHYASITYVPGITDALSREVTKRLNTIKLSKRPSSHVRLLFTNNKNKVAECDQSNVIYRGDCSGCNQCYIGETKQKLGERIKQHKYVASRCMTKASTALASHTKSSSHQFNFDGATALVHERGKSRLRVQEVHQIILNEHIACNFKKDSAHVSPLYYNLVKSTRKTQPPNSSIGTATFAVTDGTPLAQATDV